MSISLNSLNKAIRYDNRIDYYIELFQFDAELVFSFRLPILLPHLNECYCINTDEYSYDIELLKAKRKLIVAGTRNWITNRSDAKFLEFDCGTADFFTSLIIAIEIQKSELNDIIECFSDLNEIQIFQNMVLQNVLEIVLYRYNEKSGGDTFLVPSYMDCRDIDLSLYINRATSKLMRCKYVSFRMPIISYNETPISETAFADTVNNWRYFYNKSKYCNAKCDYLNCIISAAISVESYAWYVVRKNLSDEESIKTFVKEDSGEFTSATKLYKKLYDSKYICTSFTKNVLSSKIQRILNPRNQVMHGEISINVSWRDTANRVLELLTELYTDFGELIKMDSFLNEENHNPYDVQYRQYKINCSENRFASFQVMQEESQQWIARCPDMLYPRIQYVKTLFCTNEIHRALTELEKVIESTDKQSIVAVEFFGLLYKNLEIDEVIKFYNNIKDKDERVFSAIACLYIVLFQKDNDRKFVSYIVENLENAKRLSNKYILPAYLEWKMYNAISHPNERIIVKFLADKVEVDYYMPLLMAQYYSLEMNVDLMNKYLDLFYKRFKEYHYRTLFVDFIGFPINIDNVRKISLDIMNAKRKLVGNMECSELPADLISGIELNDSCSVEYITNFIKGGMPLQNLFYSDYLLIPKGDVLVK